MKLFIMGMLRWHSARLVIIACLAGSMLLPFSCLAGQANMFIYHRFGESRYPSTNIDVDLFASHLEALRKSGQLVLSLSEIVKLLKAERSLPAKSFVLTVDDAFDSFLDEAMPLIRKYPFPVTLFVNTDSVGQPGYLDWAQLRQLAREGVEIGNHTASHDYLLERNPGETADAWERRIRGDISRAQEAFARHLGVRPTLFAYPYGEYSPELALIVKDLGFDAAIAQQSGVVSDASDLFALPRFPMGGPFAALESFQSKMAMASFEVKVLRPVTPVLPDNIPPILKVSFDPERYDAERIQGFVQGGNALVFDRREQSRGIMSVQAEKPLNGRRNKYTVTVPLKDGSGWAWFSQPWFRLDSQP